MGTLRILAIGCVALLASCGTSNQTLKAEHEYRGIHRATGDETITIARLAEDVEVSTDYNLRYKLIAKATAGEYALDGEDSSGGRYFSHRWHQQVTLYYSTPIALVQAKPDPTPGGLFVDAQGRVSLYWLWDGNATRVPAPGVTVVISTEPDHDRIRAREEKEERERRAKLEQEQRERLVEEAYRRKAAALAALAEAQSRDRVQCAGPECERAFAKAQAYLLKQSDMKIQVATPTLIETYNATSDGQLSMRLIRIPAAGDRWEIVISAQCRDDRPKRPEAEDLCVKRLTEAYSGFLPHMQQSK